MGAKIKLKRMGKKKRPFYRLIVQDESEARRGKAIDEIGFYNPLLETSKLKVNKEKVLDWIAKGAKPTEKVRILLGKAGILPPVSFEGKPKRPPRAKEAPPEAAVPAAPAPAEKKEEEKAKEKGEEPKKEEPKKEEGEKGKGEREQKKKEEKKEEKKAEEPKKEEPKKEEPKKEEKQEGKEEKAEERK